MSLLLTLILGSVIGWGMAEVTHHQEERMILSIIVGIVGAVGAGGLFTLLSGGPEALMLFSWTSFMWAIIGAGILSLLLNIIPTRRIDI